MGSMSASRPLLSGYRRWTLCFALSMNPCRESLWMEDRDVSKMFLYFELHYGVQRFTGINLKPLGLSQEESPQHRWLEWKKNLTGFCSSRYNSVWMFLIVEEVIRGDRHEQPILMEPCQHKSSRIAKLSTINVLDIQTTKRWNSSQQYGKLCGQLAQCRCISRSALGTGTSYQHN